MLDLDRVLDEVERGETVKIARNGKVVARISPVEFQGESAEVE